MKERGITHCERLPRSQNFKGDIQREKEAGYQIRERSPSQKENFQSHYQPNMTPTKYKDDRRGDLYSPHGKNLPRVSNQGYQREQVDSYSKKPVHSTQFSHQKDSSEKIRRGQDKDRRMILGEIQNDKQTFDQIPKQIYNKQSQRIVDDPTLEEKSRVASKYQFYETQNFPRYVKESPSKPIQAQEHHHLINSKLANQERTITDQKLKAKNSFQQPSGVELLNQEFLRQEHVGREQHVQIQSRELNKRAPIVAATFSKSQDRISRDRFSPQIQKNLNISPGSYFNERVIPLSGGKSVRQESVQQRSRSTSAQSRQVSNQFIDNFSSKMYLPQKPAQLRSKHSVGQEAQPKLTITHSPINYNIKSRALDSQTAAEVKSIIIHKEPQKYQSPGSETRSPKSYRSEKTDLFLYPEEFKELYQNVCTLDAVNIFSEFIDMPFLLISLVRQSFIFTQDYVDKKVTSRLLKIAELFGSSLSTQLEEDLLSVLRRYGDKIRDIENQEWREMRPEVERQLLGCTTDFFGKNSSQNQEEEFTRSTLNELFQTQDFANFFSNVYQIFLYIRTCNPKIQIDFSGYQQESHSFCKFDPNQMMMIDGSCIDERMNNCVEVIPAVTTKTGGWYLGLKACHLGLKQTDIGNKKSGSISTRQINNQIISPDKQLRISRKDFGHVTNPNEKQFSPNKEVFYNLDISEVNNSLQDVRNFSGPKSKTYHKPADQSDGNQHRLMQKITNSSSSLLLKVSPENAYKRLSMISEQEDDFASNQDRYTAKPRERTSSGYKVVSSAKKLEPIVNMPLTSQQFIKKVSSRDIPGVEVRDRRVPEHQGPYFDIDNQPEGQYQVGVRRLAQNNSRLNQVIREESMTPNDVDSRLEDSLNNRISLKSLVSNTRNRQSMLPHKINSLKSHQMLNDRGIPQKDSTILREQHPVFSNKGTWEQINFSQGKGSRSVLLKSMESPTLEQLDAQRRGIMKTEQPKSQIYSKLEQLPQSNGDVRLASPSNSNHHINSTESDHKVDFQQLKKIKLYRKNNSGSDQAVDDSGEYFLDKQNRLVKLYRYQDGSYHQGKPNQQENQHLNRVDGNSVHLRITHLSPSNSDKSKISPGGERNSKMSHRQLPNDQDRKFSGRRSENQISKSPYLKPTLDEQRGMVLRREQINHKKPTHLHSNHKYSDNNDAGSNYALSHKSKFSDGELHRSKSAKQLERSLSHSPVILRRDDGRSQKHDPPKKTATISISRGNLLEYDKKHVRDAVIHPLSQKKIDQNMKRTASDYGQRKSEPEFTLSRVVKMTEKVGSAHHPIQNARRTQHTPSNSRDHSLENKKELYNDMINLKGKMKDSSKRLASLKVSKDSTRELSLNQSQLIDQKVKGYKMRQALVHISWPNQSKAFEYCDAVEN